MMHVVINHLWQSTVFAIVAGLFALAFRRNRAQVRYWLWFSASVKFLVPFALLLSLGGYLGRSPVAKSLPVPTIPYVVVQVAEPFAVGVPAPPPAQTHVDWLPIILVSLWVCGFVSVTLSRFRAWLRIRTALRSSRPLEISFPVPVRSTTHLLEPGVVGFFRPRLLLPAGIRESLTPEQLQVVLTHELCHVRRRDNLTAAIHMVVETVFWFHPLVWWISARLMEERERACDEAVLELGGEPQVYAESILKVCQLCVESPLACVPGIAGADLKRRLTRILTQHSQNKLGSYRKMLLAAVGTVVIAGPVLCGFVLPQSPAPSVQMATGPLPSFEVASIKPNPAADPYTWTVISPGRFSVTGVTTRYLIEYAYNIKGFQISGGPNWVKSKRYAINAKMEDSVAKQLQKLPPGEREEQMRLRVQSLLRDRFNLRLSRETKQASVYALVTAKNGAKLREAKPNETYRNGIEDRFGRSHPGLIQMRPGQLIGQGIPISPMVLGLDVPTSLVQYLSDLVGRPVVDKTGLKGKYDVTLTWSPDVNPRQMFGPPGPGAVAQPMAESVPAPEAIGPSVFTALKQQLGLQLKPAKGPVEVLVIDRIEQPTPN